MTAVLPDVLPARAAARRPFFTVACYFWTVVVLGTHAAVSLVGLPYMLLFDHDHRFSARFAAWITRTALSMPRNWRPAVRGLESIRLDRPTVVVMNNGPMKGGDPGTFAAIRSAKSVQALYQLHKSFKAPAGDNSANEFIANQENLTGPDAAKCPANVIKMSVAPDGKSYTISIPATGHAKTFKTKG